MILFASMITFNSVSPKLYSVDFRVAGLGYYSANNSKVCLPPDLKLSSFFVTSWPSSLTLCARYFLKIIKKHLSVLAKCLISFGTSLHPLIPPRLCLIVFSIFN